MSSILNLIGALGQFIFILSVLIGVVSWSMIGFYKLYKILQRICVRKKQGHEQYN